MKKTNRWQTAVALGVLWLPLSAAGAEAPRPAEPADFQQLADRAVDAANAGRPAEALQLFRRLELSGDALVAWTGVSGQVIVHRMVGDGDGARSLTQRIAAARPELAGLMAVWDGDTAMVEGALERALAEYRRAADLHGAQVVDGRPIGVAALRQLARAHLENQDPAKAAETERELARRFLRFVDRDGALARILAFEAMAAGGLPLKPLEKLAHDGDCSARQPCVLGRGGQVHRGAPPADARQLAGQQGLFVLADAEAAEDLARAPDASMEAAEPIPAVLACVLPTTVTGYTQPMAGQRGGGYGFMTTPDASNGWHTGIDLNRGASQEDCNDPIYAAADGCVMDVMSSTTDWGSAAIEHYSPPSTITSQYGHAYAVYVSIGQLVRRGHLIGKVGGTGSGGPNHFACHLHFEIRESDHTDRNNAGSYHNGSQSLVGDEYQDPLPFIDAHKPYTDVVWRDEESFTFTASASWTLASVGDNDDMRWALTTPVSPKTTYARHALSVPSAGTWELWAFIPYTNRSSTAVPYSLTRVSDGVAMFSATINQNDKNDAWVRIGSAALAAGVQYRIEVATNTGEANARVAVDDFRLIRPNSAGANLVVSDITFTLPPAIGVPTTATATVRNSGSVASGEFNVKWFVDDRTDALPPVMVGYGGHESLGAGQTSNGNVRFNWTPAPCANAPCTYSIEFVADVDGEVVESNEIDNSFRRQMGVNPPACGPPSTSTPGSATVCPGTFHLFTTTPSGGNGSFGYQWNVWNCTGGCSWKPVGTSQPTFNTNVVSPYNVTVTSCGQAVTSGTFTLANFSAPGITTPASVTVCPGASYTFAATASGGSGLYSYQWEEWNCTGSCSWKPVGTNSRFYTTNLVRTYRVRATSCGQSVTSGTFTLANYPALATTTPGSVTVCPGVAHTFTTVASGGSGSYSYQWYEWNCTGGCSWKPVGTNSRSYTTTLPRSYQVQVSSCGHTVGTSYFTLANFAPLATTTPQSWVTLPGFYHTFTTTPSGGGGVYTYQWYEWNCTGSCSWKPVGTNSSSFTTNLVRTYYVNVRSCGGGQSVNSGMFTLGN